MKERKDQRIGELFRSYTEQAKMPDERVTAAAKRALSPAAQAVPAAEAVPAAAGAGGGGGMRGRRVKVGFSVAGAVCLLIVLALLLWLLVPWGGSKVSLDFSQLNKVPGTTSFEGKSFLPFVQSDAVSEYDEYGLGEQSPYYEEYEGDIILYYVQYLSFGVTVDLFIEVEGFALEELEGYQDIEDNYEAQEILLYIATDEQAGETYAFFEYDVYSYYFLIHTVDEPTVYSVLEEIVYSF